MKKIYQTPVVRSCIIDEKELICESPQMLLLDDDDIADPNIVIDSRTNYNVWDDEW